MNWLFLAFIVLSPICPILFTRFNLWYAAEFYFQVGAAVLLGYSFFNGRVVKIRNLPLGILTAYITAHCAWYWYNGLANGIQSVYVVTVGYMHFLSVLFFYIAAQQLDRKAIERILEWLSYAVVAYGLICVLQYWDLFPFKVSAYVDGAARHRVVGFIGNETQNAMYLALCLPLFYLKNTRFNVLSALFMWVIISITGSGTAVLIGVSVTIFMLFWYRMSKWYYIALVCGAVGFLALHWGGLATYLNPHSRISHWAKIWAIVKESPLFGYGLGTSNLLRSKPEFFGWRHTHNEYLQYWFELGIFGLISIVYCIFEYFRGIFKDRTSIVLASIFLGFCVSSLIYFPSHLVLPGTLGIMSYSFMYALREGEDNAEYLS